MQHLPATAGQIETARAVNARLADGKVTFFTQKQPDGAELYGCVFECGSRRKSELRSYPFDDVDELVANVQHWAQRVKSQAGPKWTYDPSEVE